LFGTLGVSLVAHGAVALLVLVPRGAMPPPPAAADPAPELAGETFELPAPESLDTPLANASPSPDTNAPPAPVEFPDAPARPKPPERAKAASRPSHQARPSGGHAPPGSTDGAPGASGSTATFGAVGDRSAADLTRAFTRGFPQAASGDPVWRSVPFGAAGEATLVLTLDDAGRITDVQVVGSPSPALAQGIKRTMALIKGRPFTARGKVTRLRLSATVIPNTIPDGLHGDVFAIGASADESFFALSIGRRVELRVRAQ
jgi:outer membrane biosynthesis protein TonB